MHRRVRDIGYDDDEDASRTDFDPVGSLGSPILTPTSAAFLYGARPLGRDFGHWVSPEASNGCTRVSELGSAGNAPAPEDRRPEGDEIREATGEGEGGSEVQRSDDWGGGQAAPSDVWRVLGSSKGAELQTDAAGSGLDIHGGADLTFPMCDVGTRTVPKPQKKADFVLANDFRKISVSSVDSQPGTPSSLSRDLEDLRRSGSTAEVESPSAADESGTASVVDSESSASAALPNLPPQRSANRTELLLEEVKKELSSGGSDELNMVTIGHVDAGKSTLMGHLLYLLGSVSKKTMHKCEKDATASGKGSFAFAWLLDNDSEERRRGVTMDVCTRQFETQKRSVTLLDAPGHRDFIPNMISGASQADVALLVVDASVGEFEAGFDAQGQTKEHVILAKSLGVSQIGVAVNKLDSVGWSRARFEEISGKVRMFLKRVGFKLQDIFVVPCSGLVGENLLVREDPRLTDWYNGPTVVELIDGFRGEERLVDEPFRLVISDVFRGDGQFGLAVSGRVESGVVAVDDKLLLLPPVQVLNVKGIHVQSCGRVVRWASAGTSIDIALGAVEQRSLSVGLVLCDPIAPVQVSSRFGAKLVTLSIKYPVIRGFQCILHFQSSAVPCTIARIIRSFGRKGETTRKKPRFLGPNATAEVEIETERPLCFEVSSVCKTLSRFMLREGGTTIAVGMIIGNEGVK